MGDTLNQTGDYGGDRSQIPGMPSKLIAHIRAALAGGALSSGVYHLPDAGMTEVTLDTLPTPLDSVIILGDSRPSVDPTVHEAALNGAELLLGLVTVSATIPDPHPELRGGLMRHERQVEGNLGE